MGMEHGMRIGKKRIDRKPEKRDGVRVMVDRTWPKDLPRREARVDVWLKDLAPSRELRRWYDGDPEKRDRFKRNYFRELDFRIDEIDRLSEFARGGRVTLVYNDRGGNGCHVSVLREYLEKKADL